MLFTTPEFFIFLAIVILLIELVRHRLWQQCILLVASYFFYWYSASIHVLLLAFVTIASYFCGYMLSQAQTLKKKRVWLIIGIVIPLAVLAYFKYVDWGIAQINAFLGLFGIVDPIPVLGILLPIGISFYTFQALSYVLDIYLKKIEHEPKFYKYALYIAFFPGLVAGPIVRASEFLPQLKDKIHITTENLQKGITLIVWGLFKKMVIADNVGYYVDQVYGSLGSYSSIMVVYATILFAIQIYCDFSGYANIAIGVARIFGFVFPENFNMPYFAHNVQDYWNRWHMTLSRFIRDYVYYPLDYALTKFNRHHIKNRKVRAKANEWVVYLSLIVSMALCGLWHGAGWTYIIWGLYFGVLLALYTFFIRYKKFGAKSTFLASNPGILLKMLFCQVWVMIGFMIFRVATLDDLGICVQKLVFFDGDFSSLTLMVAIIGIALIILAFVAMSIKPVAERIKKICLFDYLGTISRAKLPIWFIYLAIMIALILIFCPLSTPEFIYFAF